MNKHFRFSGSHFSKLEDLGVCPAAVLRSAGLPQAYLNETRVLLKTEELFALWRAIGEVSPNPAIGLLLGTENRTERLNPVSLAALSTEDFGAAVNQMARFKQITCPEEIRQHKNHEEWSIRFRWLLAEEPEPTDLIECCFAWVLSIARLGTATRVSPLRVELLQPRSHIKIIERHFGCPVVCRAERNAIVFRTNRRSTAIRDPQRGTPRDACTAVRGRAEARKRRGEFSRARPTRDPTEIDGPASNHRRHRRCTPCQLAHSAAALAGCGIELSTRARGSSPPPCSPLSE
jgi:hypothetical protein